MKKSLLFTIVMALLCLFGNVKAQTTEATPVTNGVIQFTYPSSTNVLVWTGNGTDNDWTTAANWMDGTKTALKNWNDHTVANCDVFIPENANGKYPVLNQAATCNRIYLASGAMLGNQFNLTATNGWYTDIVIPTNGWVLLSSPLKNTYSGDFFTNVQGGKYYGPWDGSTYEGQNGTEGPNRNFPDGIYQRLFSSYITIDHLGLYTCRYYETSWSVPANALATNYQVAQGYQVLARNQQNDIPSADFHLPSAENTYYFYTTSGNKLTTNPQTMSHAESNRPAYDKAEIRPIITRETPGDATVPPMFAVGNPAFANLKIKEFLKENAIGGNTTPFLYKHNNGNSANYDGSESIYYLDLTNEQLYLINATADDFHIPATTNRTDATGAVMERNRGFRVMAGKAEVKCIEPDLLGVYNCNATAGEVTYNPNQGGWFSRDRTNTNLGADEKTMTISSGENPNEVIISNFAGWGVVKGTINTNDHTITLNGGQNVSMIKGRALAGSSGWTCSGRQALTLMGCEDNDFAYSTEMIDLGNNRVSKYVTNVSPSVPVRLSYQIYSNGTVNFQALNKFAMYPSNGNHYYLMTALLAGNDLLYMSPWICFASYSGSKSNIHGSTQYINTNFFGTFEYNIDVTTNWQAPNNAEYQFTINPIAGKYDIVEIKGFYPGMPNIVINGKIEKDLNNDYKLIIPAGQRISETGNITTDFFIYDESQKDVIIELASDGTFSLSAPIMATILNCETKSWNLFDWSTVPGFKTTNTITKTASWDGQVTDPTQIQIGTNKNSISLYFNENMFTVDPATTTTQAPRRSAAQGSKAATVKANYNDKEINTLLLRGEKAYNGYNPAEDAAMVDIDDEVFSISTVAGTYRCVVNAINDTTRCQIVLTGVNGDVDLVFDNLDALGENVRLFDANDSTYTPLNGNHATATVTFGVNDSPLRYSLVWDYTPIIAGNETLTAIDFTAFSPAKGEVKVMSNELLKGVRVYNAAGQLITSNNANANEVSFSNLLSGIYVIEAYTANGKATKKVDVK